MNKRCTVCPHHCKKCDDIAKSRPTEHNPTDTLCLCCKHAVPKTDHKGRYIAGCSWSMYHTPVKGWECSSVAVYKCNGKTITSYRVSKCPMFERG